MQEFILHCFRMLWFILSLLHPEICLLHLFWEKRSLGPIIFSHYVVTLKKEEKQNPKKYIFLSQNAEKRLKTLSNFDFFGAFAVCNRNYMDSIVWKLKHIGNLQTLSKAFRITSHFGKSKALTFSSSKGKPVRQDSAIAANLRHHGWSF